MQLSSIDSVFTRTETPETTDSSTTATPAPSSGFAALLEESMKHFAGETVSEEQLFAGLLQAKLAEEGDTSKIESFKSTFAEFEQTKAKPDGFIPVEDCAKATLKSMVEEGVLTAEEAAALRGWAFKAAQLDDNESALYDDRGGPGDATIATAAWAEGLTKGATAAAGLGEPSAEMVSSSDSPATGAATGTGETKVHTPDGTYVDGTEGFLFKPESDSDGNLAILIPSYLVGQVQALTLLDSEGEILETGRSSGYGNGDREHFRFTKPGNSYPENLTVEIALNDGSIIQYQIPNPAERYD